MSFGLFKGTPPAQQTTMHYTETKAATASPPVASSPNPHRTSDTATTTTTISCTSPKPHRHSSDCIRNTTAPAERLPANKQSYLATAGV